MKILVTGGAGFIGSHVADAYVAAGHDVVVVDDLSSGKRHQVPERARFVQMDIRDPRIREVFADEKPELLNHHAAQMDVRRSVADPGFDADVNIMGFLNLLEGARAAGTRRVLFASSGGAAYGEQDEFPAPETHKLEPVSPYGVSKRASELYLGCYRSMYGLEYVAMRYANVYGPRQDPHGEAGVVAIFTLKLLNGEQDEFPAPETHKLEPVSPYGVSKRASELYLGCYRSMYGLEYVAMRYANVYGPRQDPHGEAGVVAIFTLKLLSGEQPTINGDGTQTRDYVFVGDLVRANVALATHDYVGPMNFGTGIETDVNQLFGHIRTACGVDAPEQHGPGKPGEQRRSVISPALAGRVIGWRPEVALHDGIARTVGFFRDRAAAGKAH